MNPRIHRQGLSVLLLAAVAIVLGCGPQSAEVPPSAPAVVTVSQPVLKNVTDTAQFTGRTAAVESVEVRARVSGYLQDILFQPGQEVKKDQQLFQIDPTIYQAALDKARASVAQYESEVKLSAAEHERARRLVVTGAVSQEEFEKAAAQREQARANLVGAKAAVKTAQQNLDWTKVMAPVDGRTSVNRLTKGNLVVADQTMLTTLVSVDPMYAYFDVDESTMLEVQRLIRQGKATSYQKAAYPIEIGLANEEGYPHHGTIDYVSNQVNTATGTLNVRGVFPNPERILTPGLFARVRIPIGQPHKALLVTDRAMGSDQGQPFLLVVDSNNQVGRRDVQIGTLHDGGLREIKAGVQQADWVIVDGLLRVRAGVTVEPKRQPMPMHPGSPDRSSAADPAARSNQNQPNK